LVPNETTVAAMREARAGNLDGFDSVEALMADLHAKD
jgi:DNA-damage-inducible protein J